MNILLWSIRNIGVRKLLWIILFIIYLNLTGYMSPPNPCLHPDPIFDWFVRRLEP